MDTAACAASRSTWRTTDGWNTPIRWRPRVSANNKTVRSDKRRNYAERGGAHPAMTFDSYAASSDASSTLPLPTLAMFASAQILTSLKECADVIGERRKRKSCHRKVE